MFSLLTKDSGVALRLPDGDRENFLKRYKTVLCEQHGAVMKEYVVVPDGLLKKTRELKPYFDASNAVKSMEGVYTALNLTTDITMPSIEIVAPHNNESLSEISSEILSTHSLSNTKL